MRVITRLDETCREVRDAARVIGDAELFKKMEEAQIKIKRDSKRFSSSLLFHTNSRPCSRVRRKLVFLVPAVASIPHSTFAHRTSNESFLTSP